VDNDTDQALVERYRNGDREAFATLVIRYQRPIYNAAFWILRRPRMSDIAQIVF
jgi:DNA-directed RNA polymerase specialized sigma24 family protein